MFGIDDIAMIFIWSILLAFFLVILTRILVDQNKVRQIRNDMNFYKNKMNEAQKTGNTEEAKKHMAEFTGLSKKQLSMNMRPLMVSMVLFLIILSFFWQWYGELIVPLPFWGWELSWLWWYILVSIPANLFFRKMLGVE